MHIILEISLGLRQTKKGFVFLFFRCHLFVFLMVEIVFEFRVFEYSQGLLTYTHEDRQCVFFSHHMKTLSQKRDKCSMHLDFAVAKKVMRKQKIGLRFIIWMIQSIHRSPVFRCVRFFPTVELACIQRFSSSQDRYTFCVHKINRCSKRKKMRYDIKNDDVFGSSNYFKLHFPFEAGILSFLLPQLAQV